MKKLKAVVEDEENRFGRLPDEMVIAILNKLVHAKHIFRCSSVCKRFGSLIYHIQTIFLPSPLCRLANLKKFLAIRSIRIKFDFPITKHHPGMIVRFRAVFRARLDVAVFFIAPPPDGGHFDGQELVLNLVKGFLFLFLKLHDFSRDLFSSLPVLRQVLIDTAYGSLFMGKDEIAANNSNSPSSETFGANIFRDRLELPASGLVMPNTYIVVVRPEGEEIMMERDLGLILDSFEADYEFNEYYHNQEDDVGKIFDQVVTVVRKKIATDRNGDLITMHQLTAKLPKSVNLFD